MTDCIFCKIANKEIPAEMPTWEDAHFFAFPDIHPEAPGHTLLVTKQHFHWMQDVPDDLIAHIFVQAKNIMLELKEKYSADYVAVKVIGKDVPHFHIHLIPMKQ